MSNLERRVAKIEKSVGIGKDRAEPLVVVIAIKPDEVDGLDPEESEELLGPYDDWVTYRRLVENAKNDPNGLDTVVFIPDSRQECEARGIAIPKKADQTEQ